MRVSLDEIKKVVCNHYNLDEKLLFSKSRMRHIITPRQVFTYLAYNINRDIGYTALAKYMGVSSSNLVCSNKSTQGFMDVDKFYRSEIANLYEECLKYSVEEDIEEEINMELVVELNDNLLNCQTNLELKELLIKTLKKL